MSKGLTEMPKVGDKLRCISKMGFVTVGKVYEVFGHDKDGDAIMRDDDNNYDDPFDINEGIFDCFELVSEAGADAVNPDHYKRGKYETIEIIEHITAGYDDGFIAHCAGTAIKYIARAPFKHATPTEDLRKAARYLEFAIKRLEAEAIE